jgi:hypothetical protein
MQSPTAKAHLSARAVARNGPTASSKPAIGSLFDNNWAEKQANSFKDWMNYTFNKPNDLQSLMDSADVAELEPCNEKAAQGAKATR